MGHDTPIILGSPRRNKSGANSLRYWTGVVDGRPTQLGRSEPAAWSFHGSRYPALIADFSELLPLRTGRGSFGIGTRGTTRCPGFFDRRKANPSVVGG
jgi:hypothetical protein